jgi:hypothetical protein
MNTKTEKDKNRGQQTSKPSQDKNKQKESNQQGKKSGFKEGLADNDGWSEDVENDASQKQEPEIDTPVHEPEKTEKKIPNMRNGL